MVALPFDCYYLHACRTIVFVRLRSNNPLVVKCFEFDPSASALHLKISAVTVSEGVVGVVMVTVSEGVAGWIDRCVHHQICFRHYLLLLPSTVPVVVAVLSIVPCV